jgi:hypothetical protein
MAALLTHAAAKGVHSHQGGQPLLQQYNDCLKVHGAIVAHLPDHKKPRQVCTWRGFLLLRQKPCGF